MEVFDAYFIVNLRWNHQRDHMRRYTSSKYKGEEMLHGGTHMPDLPKSDRFLVPYLA